MLDAAIKPKFVKIYTRNGNLEVPEVLGSKKEERKVVLKKADENGEVIFPIFNLSPYPKTLLKGDKVGEAQIVRHKKI